MKKFYTICLVLAFFATFANLIANDNSERQSSFSVSLSQDPQLGFYPAITGSIPIGEKTDLTFYGIFWTQDILAGNQGGLNLLTEFGFGVNFSLLDGALNINPSLGFCHGNYASGGGKAVIGDNIVPSLFIGYSENDFNLNFATYYYNYLRKESKKNPLIHLFEYVFKTNYNFSKYLNAGIFYDHYLYANNYSFIDPNKDKIKFNTVYCAVGPEIKLSFKENASVAFAIGPDFADYFNKADNKKIKDYYKLSTFISF